MKNFKVTVEELTMVENTSEYTRTQAPMVERKVAIFQQDVEALNMQDLVAVVNNLPTNNYKPRGQTA